MIRSEALFADEGKRATAALAKVANKLWIAIEMWHQHEIKSRLGEERLTPVYNIMYGVDPSENDGIPEAARKDNGFHAEFKAALLGIEKAFRPHVDRGKRRN